MNSIDSGSTLRGMIDTAADGEAGTVRMLDCDPELADALDDHELEQARRVLVAPTLTLEEGPWRPRGVARAGSGHLGVLVVDGLLCREVCVAGTRSDELLGPGDLLRPWDELSPVEMMPCEVHWQVLKRAQLAVLGPRFSQTAARWPALSSALVARAVARAQGLALVRAISCTTGLDKRLLILFWHLAGRWGRVRRDGIVMPIPLTHKLIGRLVGARRPSVSTALKQLERDGRLARLHDGGWLLTGEPPRESAALHDGSRMDQALPILSLAGSAGS